MPESDPHAAPTPPAGMAHRARRMIGRDPHERGRTATPLELLFDLTFVVAFGQAASLFGHSLAAGHTGSGLLSFLFATFAVSWAWINFAWFASAFDNDDWLYRVLVMVQMVGVIILALGLPAMFHGIEEGEHVGNGVMVLGYVVMRIPMVVHWLRSAKHDPQYRAPAMTFVLTLVVSQIGWVALALVDPPIVAFFVAGAALIVIEMVGPFKAERHRGETPWHAHHIAERYGLLTIICLGEGIVGTVATLSAVIQVQGWTIEAALVVVAGTGLTFGLWWMYYMIPAGEILHVHRRRGFAWGYNHMAIFGSIVATGAGLEVAGLYIEGEAEISAAGAVLAVTIPVAIYVLTIFGLYTYLVRSLDPFHIGLVAGTALVLVLAGTLASAGVSMGVCLLVVMCAPVVTVVGYETIGHRHAAVALQKALSTEPA